MTITVVSVMVTETYDGKCNGWDGRTEVPIRTMMLMETFGLRQKRRRRGVVVLLKVTTETQRTNNQIKVPDPTSWDWPFLDLLHGLRNNVLVDPYSDNCETSRWHPSLKELGFFTKISAHWLFIVYRWYQHFILHFKTVKIPYFY